MSYAINFTPSVKQWQAWEYLQDDEMEFIGYGGSAFSGKSYLLCYWLTIMCTAYPDTGWGLGRKELTTLKKTTLLTLFKVFAECNIKPDEHYNYNQQLNIITFYNKSQIFLIDTAYKPADPLYTRFGGLELTGVAIDESAETDHKAIEILYTRTGRRNNLKYSLRRKILETFNPAKNHVYTRYYLPFKKQKPKARHVFIPALPSDNPSPEVPEYIAGILATGNTVTIERLIKGNFEYDDDPAALMNFEAIVNVFNNSHVPEGDYAITVDVARKGRDRSVIMLWKGWQVVRLIWYPVNTTVQIEEKVKELRSIYQVPAFRVVVDDDGVGGGVTDHIPGCHGFVNGASPVAMRNSEGFLIKENFRNLKSQCYFKLAARINNGGLWVATEVDSDIKELIISDLEQVKQKDIDKDGKVAVRPKEEVKEAIGRSPDFSDALMMREYLELVKVEHYVL